MKTVRVDGPAPEAMASGLLVHGNDLCAEFYLPLAERVAAAGIAMTLVTLPGFDDVPPYDTPSWQRYANDIAAAVAALTAPRVLIGHSMGGMMAFLAAAELGDALDYLVLIEPAIYPRRFMARAASRGYLSRVVHGDRDAFVNSTGVMPRVHDVAAYPADKIELYRRVRRRSHVPTMTALFTELPQLYPLPFSAVRARTLMLSGRNIGVRGRMLARMVRKRLVGVDHAVIDRAAHWVVNEQDEALARHIQELVC